MQKKPFGADMDFYDGEWIFPLALLALATLFGDVLWGKQIMTIIFVIACFHTVHEHKIAFGKKGIAMRSFYALLGLLSGMLLHFVLPLIYVVLSYSLSASKLKQDGEEQLLVKKRKTYVTIMAILIFATGVHAWKEFLIYNDIVAIQTEQEQTGQAGTISQ